jgi:hypothetical protein
MTDLLRLVSRDFKLLGHDQDGCGGLIMSLNSFGKRVLFWTCARTNRFAVDFIRCGQSRKEQIEALV